MALIDEAKLKVISGAGGNGCISFRREKYVPRGGPNGGNGGRGGDVWVEGTRDKTSLLDFKFRPKFEGERGEHGMGSDCFGRAGADLVLQMPLGTQIYDAETNELICDLTRHGQKELLAPGGKGGRGNLSFATSTNRAPRIATPGEPGVVRDLRLELKLIADVGLIGLPNAGKSSFLRSRSRATPKVADYPFTTLEPHLGVVDHKSQSFVAADLPGLIEGASEGVGLGHKFLKHVARNRVLLHLVDLSEENEKIVENIDVIRKELGAFDPELREREEFLVFTKCDLFDDVALAKKRESLGLEGFFVSSHSGYGMEALLDALCNRLHDLRSREVDPEAVVVDETAETPDAEDRVTGG